MEATRKTVEGFYATAQRRDMSTAREFLNPNLTFYGLFETYRNADELGPEGYGESLCDRGSDHHPDLESTF